MAPRPFPLSARLGVACLMLAVPVLLLAAVEAGTPLPASADSLCGAPVNNLGITYCSTLGGVPITQANVPQGVCSPAGPFTCVSDFTTVQGGYMVECGGGKVSMAGGKSGACGSGDGGVLRQVFLLASGATTTQPTPATTLPPTTVPPTTAPPATTTPPAVVAPVVQPATAAAAPNPNLAMTGPGLGVVLIALTGASLTLLGVVLPFMFVRPRRRRRAVAALRWSSVADLIK